MKYPLVGLSIAFCLGIIIASCIKIAFLVFYLLAFLFLTLSIIYIKQNLKFHIFALGALFFLGSAVLSNAKILPVCHIANFTPNKGERVYLMGIVDSDPAYEGRCSSFVLKAERLKREDIWQAVCGTVLVRDFNKREIFYGERVFLEGTLYRPFSFSKGFNYRDYLKHQGVYSIVSVKKGRAFEIVNSGSGNRIKSFSFRAKHGMRNIITSNLSPLSAGVVNAIILGDRQSLSARLRDDLVKSGTVHIIAISGLNLWIVAYIIMTLLKITRIHIKLQYAITIVLLFIYCILTGSNIPVVRATIMALIFLFGYLIGRESNIYNFLALAALAILAFNPWQIFEVSFQLSFLSIIAIVWLSPKFSSLFPETFQKKTWARFVILTFSTSMAAWIGLLPIIAYYFKIISPITVIANMIIVPYMTLITAASFALICIGILAPILAPSFAASCELFVLTLFKINSLLIKIPGAYFKIGKLSFGDLLFYYILLVIIFGFNRGEKERA